MVNLLVKSVNKLVIYLFIHSELSGIEMVPAGPHQQLHYIELDTKKHCKTNFIIKTKRELFFFGQQNSEQFQEYMIKNIYFLCKKVGRERVGIFKVCSGPIMPHFMKQFGCECVCEG